MSSFGQSGAKRNVSNIPLFVINCERIRKTSWYKVAFQPNNQIINRIKKGDRNHYKWSLEDHCWHLHTKALYELMKSYRRSDKLKFEFGVEGRLEFIELLKDIDKETEEHEDRVERLRKKNEEALAWKIELENNWQNYEADALALFKPGVKLYPHQVVAIMFLKKVLNGLLSLEMGLGKTLCSIGYAELMGFKKILVITPNSLKFNYKEEVEKFTNQKTFIINYKNNVNKLIEAKYVIVNYDYFNPKDFKKVKKKFKELNLGFIECVVCDESHLLKNTDANTYKNFKKLFKDIPSKVFLSGTPAPNRVKELFTILNQIAPLDFPTKTDFYKDYCGMEYVINKKDGKNGDETKAVGTWVQGTLRLEELYHKIQPYTYRKRKQEVLKDLPDKIYQRVMLEMTEDQLREYNKIEEGVANEIFSQDEMSINVLTIMLRLRQYTAMMKINAVHELATRLLDEGEKSVIVDNFKTSLLELHKKFGDISVLHTGDQDDEERNRAKNDFQNENGKAQIFLASISTTKYGLTLTAASKLFIITLPFSVGEYDQVADRLHRIGQKDVVFIYSLIMKDSIDEYVFNMIEQKRIEILKAIDNEDYKAKIEESILSELLEYFRKKYKK